MSFSTVAEPANISQKLRDALKAEGIVTLNEVQERAVQNGLLGKDVLCCAQTGGGKTLAFLIPILEQLLNTVADTNSKVIGAGPQTVVLAPTPELAGQHREVAEAIIARTGVDAALLAEHVLIDTPRAFLSRVRSGELSLNRLRSVAIDEVDFVLCGGAFDAALTPQGNDLLSTLRSEGTPQFLLATAHLSNEHEGILKNSFPGLQTIRQTATTTSGVLVPTLRQRFHYFQGDKDAKLLTVLQQAKDDEWLCEGSLIIFCPDPQTAARAHSLIATASTDTPPLLLHEALPDSAREKAASDFRQAARGILVCTEAVARGLDFPSVRHVLMYAVPVDVAAFVHCAGRTARRGRQGLLTCLVANMLEVNRYQHLHALQAANKLTFSS
jgi:superfamily II DNA/RNA helicase